MCNCTKRGNPTDTGGGSRKVASRTPGELVKLKYLGDSNELISFEGAATRTEYTVGGRFNLIEAYSSDLATGISWAPGLLELRGKGGEKLFKIHAPLKEEIEAEAASKARVKEAWEAAEELALSSEEPEVKEEEPDGESTLSGD